MPDPGRLALTAQGGRSFFSRTATTMSEIEARRTELELRCLHVFLSRFESGRLLRDELLLADDGSLR